MGQEIEQANQQETALFTHRRKVDGTVDSICLACLSTIASQAVESDLQREEEEHVCRFSFPSRRSGRLPAGLKEGRRKSDLEWKRQLSR